MENYQKKYNEENNIIKDSQEILNCLKKIQSVVSVFNHVFQQKTVVIILAIIDGRSDVNTILSVRNSS